MGEMSFGFMLGATVASVLLLVGAMISDVSGLEGCREATGAKSCQMLWVPERGVGNGG